MSAMSVMSCNSKVRLQVTGCCKLQQSLTQIWFIWIGEESCGKRREKYEQWHNELTTQLPATLESMSHLSWQIQTSSSGTRPSLLLIHHHVGIVHLDGVLSCFPRLQVVLGWSRSSRQLVQGCVVELPIPCSGAARSMGVDLLAQTCKRSPGAAYVELDRPQGQSQRALSRSNEWRGVLLSYPRYSWRACYQRKGWTEGMLKESHSAREAQKSCALLFFNSISVKGSHQAKSSSPSACSVASSLRSLWMERCLVVGLKGPWCFLTAGSRHTPARCGGSCTWAGTSLLRTSLMRSQQRLPLYRKCCSTRKVVWKVRKHPGQTSDCT